MAEYTGNRMEKAFDDDETDALDSILENSVVELDEALQRTQQEELVAGVTEESIAAFSKQLPTTPTHHLHQQLPTEMFVSDDRLVGVVNPLDTIVSESTLGSPSNAQNASVYTSSSGSVCFHPPTPPTSGSCIKMPSTASSCPGPSVLPAFGTSIGGLQPSSPFLATVDLTQKRVGRWGMEEKILFLYGFRKFGRKWKQIQKFVPCRTLVQIKSHGQKVLKRIEAGENVFRRLDENSERIMPIVSLLDASPSAPATLANNRPRRTEHITAVSALCQLGDNSKGASGHSCIAEARSSMSR